MSDPIISVTSAEIVKLAFSEFVKTSTGEAAKKLTGKALEIANTLRNNILDYFKSNSNQEIEEIIRSFGDQISSETITKVTEYLDDAMNSNAALAKDLRILALQIASTHKDNMRTINQENNNYGRDQVIINSPQGNIKFGGS